MAEPADGEFLRSIFLMEAWDTVVALEHALGALTHEARADLFVLTHRLKGAASLHGFNDVAALADEMEQLVQTFTVDTAVADMVTRLGALLAPLKAALEAIGSAAESVGLEAPPPAVPAPLAADPVRDELERFVTAGPDVLSYFGPEAGEHLDRIVASLLALERGDTGEELAHLFRAVHTLKGAALVVGCGPVGRIAHRMEDLLGAARDGALALAPSMVQTLFEGADLMRSMLSWPLPRDVEFTWAADRVLEQLAAHLADATTGTEQPGSTPAPAPSWEPSPSAPADADAQMMTVSLAATHPAGALAPRIVPPPRMSRQTVRVGLEHLDALMDLVGELIIARSRLDRRLADFDRVSGALAASRARLADTVAGFERRHLHDPVARTGGRASGASSPLRAAAPVSQLFAELEFDRYDDASILTRRVAEIAADIADAQTELAAIGRAVREDVAHVQRLTLAMRAEVGRARLVPIGSLFTRFARQATEAARAAGKNVHVQTSGESVEIDTSLIEQIVDPMLHLVQNAVTHGIESDAERAAAGKPVPATIGLSAWSQSGAVLVEIADDGRGIEAAAIRRHAVERGFLAAEAATALSDAEALNLIFEPGFSTAATVTAAAGRGVGLDVVRTNVRRLNGEVEVNTIPGIGTRFTLRLPLTVLVSEALLVRAGGETFAVPVNAIYAVLELAASDIHRGRQGERVDVDERPTRLLRLAPVLALPAASRGARVRALALRAGGALIVVEVDNVLHKEDIVIKPLGAFLDGVGPWAGASVAPDGSVRLLLDPLALAARADAALAAPTAEPGQPREAARPRVLLVDDSPSVRRFVGAMLGKAGCDVTTAVDGADALARLADASFDVIVTDLEMPRVNGYELIESVQRRGGRATPIVVLTTRAGDKHASLARRLGVEHYVAKPVDEESFVRLVGALARAA